MPHLAIQESASRQRAVLAGTERGPEGLRRLTSPTFRSMMCQAMSPVMYFVMHPVMCLVMSDDVKLSEVLWPAIP
jgi:hypothetical protein